MNARPSEIDEVTSTMVSMTCAATSASRMVREPRMSLEPRVPNVGTRLAYSDGSTPNSKPLSTDTAMANASTRPSSREYVWVASAAG